MFLKLNHICPNISIHVIANKTTNIKPNKFYIIQGDFMGDVKINLLITFP